MSKWDKVDFIAKNVLFKTIEVQCSCHACGCQFNVHIAVESRYDSVKVRHCPLCGGEPVNLISSNPKIDQWNVTPAQRDKVLSFAGDLFERGNQFIPFFTKRRCDACSMSYSILYDGLGIVR